MNFVEKAANDIARQKRVKYELLVLECITRVFSRNFWLVYPILNSHVWWPKTRVFDFVFLFNGDTDFSGNSAFDLRCENVNILNFETFSLQISF